MANDDGDGLEAKDRETVRTLTTTTTRGNAIGIGCWHDGSRWIRPGLGDLSATWSENEIAGDGREIWTSGGSWLDLDLADDHDDDWDFGTLAGAADAAAMTCSAISSAHQSQTSQ